MTKTLVLYVFDKYNNRVKHFIDNAVFYDENIDFVFISNGTNNVFEVPNYVKKILRDNVGYDFGGWSFALLENDLYKNYDYFIFANSSIIGPFLPPNFKGKWTDIYINGLQDNIKLFGSTINTINDPKNKSHIQSYIFSLDKTTLEYLIECEIFSVNNYTKTLLETVFNKEIEMSRKIIQNEWNIGSLFNYYSGVDFTFKTKKIQDYNLTFLGDIMFSKYRNTLWHDSEIVFIKGNRMGL
jgi:hypothetical protein